MGALRSSACLKCGCLIRGIENEKGNGKGGERGRKRVVLHVHGYLDVSTPSPMYELVIRGREDQDFSKDIYFMECGTDSQGE